MKRTFVVLFVIAAFVFLLFSLNSLAASAQEECHVKAPKLTQELYRPGLVRYHKPTVFKIQGRAKVPYGFFLSLKRSPGFRAANGVRVPINIYTDGGLDPLLLASFVYGNTKYLPNFFGRLDPKGAAYPVINLPAFGYFPSLVGLKFYGVGLTSTGHPLDLRVSNSMALTIAP